MDVIRSLIERFVDISPYKEVKLGINGASVHSSAAVNQNLQPTSLPHPSSTISRAAVNKILSAELYYACRCQ